MEVSMSSRDLFRIGPVGFRGTLQVLPRGKRSKPKIVVGDDSGSIHCIEVEKGVAKRAFKTLAGSKPVSSVALGGAPLKKDRVFYATSQTIAGVSKKGKEFFRFDTTLSETITSSFSEETRLWLAAATDYGLFDNGAEMESYAAPDIIQDLAVANVTRDTEADAVLACGDGAVRVIAAGASVLEYRSAGGGTVQGSSSLPSASEAASIGGRSGGGRSSSVAAGSGVSGVSGARSVHFYQPTLQYGESAALPGSSAAAAEAASSRPGGASSTPQATRAGRGQLPSGLNPRKARHFAVGSGSGAVVLLEAASDSMRPRWTLRPSKGRAGGGAVNAISSLDVTGDGCLDVIVGRDDGMVDVLASESGPHDPALVYQHSIGDAVQGMQTAAVSSQSDGEILAVSFSGKLTSITTESLSAAAEGDRYGRSKEVVEREARVASLRDEMRALEQQVEKQRASMLDAYKQSGLSTPALEAIEVAAGAMTRAQKHDGVASAEVAGQAAGLMALAEPVTAECRLEVDESTASYRIAVESASLIESVSLLSPIPLEVLRTEHSANAIVSTTVESAAKGAQAAAACGPDEATFDPKDNAYGPAGCDSWCSVHTFRCQELSHRLELRARSREGLHGEIELIVVAGPGASGRQAAAVGTVQVRPLSLHCRCSDSAFDEAAAAARTEVTDPWKPEAGPAAVAQAAARQAQGALVVRGDFSLGRAHDWIGRLLPGVPARPDTESAAASYAEHAATERGVHTGASAAEAAHLLPLSVRVGGTADALSSTSGESGRDRGGMPAAGSGRSSGPSSRAVLVFRNCLIGSLLRVDYCRGELVLRSCNASTLAIARSWLLERAAADKLNLDMDWHMPVDGLRATWGLLHPRVKYAASLSKRADLADAVKEVAQQEDGERPWLSQELKDVLQYGGRYRKELDSQPNKLEALHGVVQDLFVHHHRALGADVSGKLAELDTLVREAYEFRSSPGRAGAAAEEFSASAIGGVTGGGDAEVQAQLFDFMLGATGSAGEC